MLIRLDDLRGQAIADLLAEHLRDMHATSPKESVHALDLEALRQPDISFWTAWDADALAGCGALKQLDSQHGEIKSMRTAARYRRRGVGKLLLEHLIAQARQRGYQRLSLETGSMAYFTPACELYKRFGFVKCAPFASYRLDPYSVFMTLAL
jgi:putative acetyltransferase